MARAFINNILTNNNPMLLADYRKVGADFLAALISLGWVQTADTGQVNYATVAAVPTSAGADYFVVRMNDTLSASSPCYIKFMSWSTSAISGKAFEFDWIVCTRTNGAGTPQVNLSGQFSMHQTNSAVVAPGLLACFFSGDPGRLSICWNPNNNLAGIGNIAEPMGGLCVERLKDSHGNDTNLGFACIADTKSQGHLQQTIFAEAYGGIYPSSPQQWVCASPSVGTSSFGNSLGVFPVFPNVGVAANPMVGFLAFFTNDIPVAASIVQASLYGITHSYVVGGYNGTLSTYGLNANGYISLGLWRYD